MSKQVLTILGKLFLTTHGSVREKKSSDKDNAISKTLSKRRKFAHPILHPAILLSFMSREQPATSLSTPLAITGCTSTTLTGRPKTHHKYLSRVSNSPMWSIGSRSINTSHWFQASIFFTGKCFSPCAPAMSSSMPGASKKQRHNQCDDYHY